eukprot:5536550-Amphidinium_carterae.1
MCIRDRDGGALRYASAELRADRELVLFAVSRNGRVIKYQSEQLRGDREIALAAVKQYWGALHWLDESLRHDREIALLAVSQFGPSISYISRDLCADHEIVLTAVCKCGSSLEHASPALRGERAIALSAIAQCPGAIAHVSDKLLSDDSFLCDCKTSYFILRVAMLSGRECILAVDPERGGADDKERVVGLCCRKLGIGTVKHAELVFGRQPVPRMPLSCWPGLALGKVNDIQLVLGTE